MNWIRDHAGGAKTVAVATMLALFLGCVTTTPLPREVPASKYRFSPPLEPNVTLQVFAEDLRPRVETEKNPSGPFLYSGALFPADGNVKTIATGLCGIATKFGGVRQASLSSTNPTSGPAVVFQLQHWYSRAPLKSEKPMVLVDGQFSGTVVLQRDGRTVASRQIVAQGTPSIVDMYIVFDREKRETPGLIRKAMEQTANSAEQNGYSEIAKFFQEAWPSFQLSH